MADQQAMLSAPVIVPPPTLLEQKLKKSSPGRLGMLIFGLVLLGGLIFIGNRLLSDLAGVHVTSAWPYILLALALLIALAFEFVNGFHDTANAVATVIYTHSMEPHVAVVYSGIWNLIGVLLSSGAVAFAVVSLLPVELILQVGRGAGFAMVFALLVSAIIWNLGTWWFGLPASSSHTLIGSIIGVGLANQLMAVKTGTSGVDWGQAANVFRSLLISPVVGFACAALLLLVAKKLIKDPRLYKAPEGDAPPPFWIRGLLILTCTGVSFAHGSNDGQKGMGLIMLILIGTVPTAYALNHAVGINQVQDFAAVSEQAIQAVSHYIDPNAVVGDTRDEVTAYIRTREFKPSTMLAMQQLMGDIEHEVILYKALAKVPADRQANVRNDMYVISEALRLMQKSGKPALAPSDTAALANYKKHLDLA
ncbi:MAG TPA: inorganic phosphate transporter, partial [Candidatus Acidoferrales bacterium]|nr:inorganic phosphate transporter [Candidatus Acidoferrales bacterium]